VSLEEKEKEEEERERARARERENLVLSFIRISHNGESRASPAHGLRITMLTGLFDRLASIWRRLSPD
jgi:hypothetical protein